MPGVFGGIGCADPQVYALLRAQFAKIWRGCESRQDADWALGGHAFRGKRPLFSTSRYHYAIDGAYSVYAHPMVSSSAFSHDFLIKEGGLQLGSNHMGNVALIDAVDEVLYLSVEWSGTFPLYFVQYRGGVLFSSHLRPLAHVTRKPVDDLGLLEFLRYGFTFGGRTLFADIHRLLPGQSVRYSVRTGQISISETSRAWLTDQEDVSPDETADEAWRLLDETIRRSIPTNENVGLMMSGGWDSRTLLAALDAPMQRRLTCYSHGDTKSRELNIVAGLASSNRANCRLEPIDARVLDPGDLRRDFDKVENVIFPHWHRAGRLLSDMAVVCATAGVYGEVLGGHYGPSGLLGGHRMMTAVVGGMLRTPNRRSREPAGASQVESLLRTKPFGHHWYLRQEFENAIPSACDRINADVDADVLRLRRRGISSPYRLIEAFTAEHRGSHYINAQLLSCRSHIDIAMPFAEQALVAFGSGVPIEVKIHNMLNRRMLQRHAPMLLHFPMAATLLPASAPLLLQEASRLLRKAYEDARLTLHDRTHGKIGPPRLGWVNFEFLRSGDGMLHLMEDLQCDYWDRHTLEQRLRPPNSTTATDLLYPIYNQMAKVYTADLLCR